MSQKLRGFISITQGGTGFVESEKFKKDIQIQSQFLNTALYGDEVEFFLFPGKKNGRLSGAVTSVLKRSRDELVGTILINKDNGRFFLKPDDKRMHVDILLPNAKKEGAKNNFKAVVRLADWRDPQKNPEGKIIKIIGQKGLNETEMKSIVYEKGFKIDFPPAVKAETSVLKKKFESFSQEEKTRRRDFRGVPTFTIDPGDAKDFDDAISVKKISENLFEIGIHIADVSYYVKKNSAIDKEARKRGVSVYLVDRTIPMLPEILSNDVCSLNPNEDKLTFSVVFHIFSSGKIKKVWFGETVINSQKRFTYKEAQDILDKKSGIFFRELYEINKLAKILRKRRIENGALDFDEVEIKFELDKQGKPIRVFEEPRLDVNKLIEEFMILANKEVAGHFGKLPLKNSNRMVASIFRIHDAPDAGEMSTLMKFLRRLGYDVKIKGTELIPKELNALFREVKGRQEEFLVKNIVMRAMEKAVYSSKKESHFGLALEVYTHFTSPIRRYADLVVHRILKKRLFGKEVKRGEKEEYQEVAQEVTRREIMALEAERGSVCLKQVEYMLERLGNVFEGIISGISERGMFIQEISTKSNGMIHLRDLKDDFYELDKDNYSLVGRNTKKRFFLGDRVKFKAVGGDTDKKTLDFILV